MGRVVIVGGGGFIGQHVRAALVGHEVLCIGRHRASEPGWIKMDLGACSTGELARKLSEFGPDAVINSAGATEGDARVMASANVLVVATLLGALARAAPAARLVHIGSAAEYGPSEGSQPVSERSPPHPTSYYGVTKLAATQLVMTATAYGAVDGMVIRLFNPVGAGMSDATLPGRAARQFRDAQRQGTTQTTFRALTAVRDFVDARDAADAIVAAAFIAQPAERLINCGSGEATPARALVEALAAIAGYEGAMLEQDSESARSSGVAWQIADTTRSERVLGWRTTRTLDDALRCLWDGLG